MTEQQLMERGGDDATGALIPHQPSMTSQTYASASSAANTRRAYRADWSDFTDWCEHAGRESLPATPVTIADYLAARAAGDDEHPALAVATLERRLVAITRAHQLRGLPSPVDEWVRTVLKGIRRKHRTAQRRVAPVGVEVLRQAITALPETLLGTRDRALLLVGFANALRRSELVGLAVGDVQFVPPGAHPDSASLQDRPGGRGCAEGHPLGSNATTCPVRALQAWIKAAGFDPDDYSGHSLRAGLATAAAAQGAPTYTIRRQTGHKSDRILEIYIREGSLFHNNVAGMVGL